MSLVAARGRRHFSAADLVDDARRRGIRIGRATVFRTLDRLLAGGIIERIDLPDREHAYVACQARHHHHVICMGCGRSSDADDGDLRGVIAAVERATGYAIDGHRLELFGRCPACLGSREP
jgi:Fur family transcriptional regulator, ferric uptake regulator